MKTNVKIKTSEILVRARELIDRPEKWTKIIFARNENDCERSVESRQATKYCAVGSCRRAYYEATGDARYSSRAQKELRDAMDSVIPPKPGEFYRSVSGFNDRVETQHGDVMRLFDEAIRVAKTKEETRNG